MNLLKSPVALIGVIICAILAMGLLSRFRPSSGMAASPEPPPETRKVPPGPAQAKAHQPAPGKPASESIKIPRSFTSHELVAIYESKGAAAAIAAAKSMTGPERETQVTFILTYLARIDPELVARELKEAGLDTTHQGFIVEAVMNDWKDGKKALEWATTNFTGDLLKTAVGGALRILVRTDPDTALAYLETLPASGSRDQAMSDIFVTWGECDPVAALKLLAEKLPVDDRSSAMSNVIYGWSRIHPSEAAAWVETVQDETLQVGLVVNVTLNWKTKSPTEAIAWVESLPDGPGEDAGKSVINEIEMKIVCGISTELPDESWKTKEVAKMETTDFWNWGYQDPEGARKFLETNPQGIDLSGLAIPVASGIKTKEGPEATFVWAQTLQGEAEKAALRLAVISWADSDPAAAAEKIKSLPAEQQAPLATDLAENWSKNDPATAAAWVAGYDGAEQKTLVVKILERWTDSQPREAYTWLGTLPMGPARDEGIDYLMRREASSDPKSVLPWIDLLSGPQLRTEMRQRLDGYLKTDPTGN